MDSYLYEESRFRLARAARTMGIIALVIAIAGSYFSFLSIMLGSFALLLEYLSRGGTKKIEKIALATGSLSIIIALTISGSAVYKLASDDDYRHSIFETSAVFYSEFYGPEYGEYVYEIEDKINKVLGE